MQNRVNICEVHIGSVWFHFILLYYSQEQHYRAEAEVVEVPAERRGLGVEAAELGVLAGPGAGVLLVVEEVSQRSGVDVGFLK